jgi:hypothetical protein
VLDPWQKLEHYQSNAFEPKYIKIYKDKVRAFYKAGYAHLDRVKAEGSEGQGGFTIDLASVQAMECSSHSKATHRLSAFDHYLKSPIVKVVDPLTHWASQKRIWPCLLQMAMDILLVPASEVEVERIFSIAR